MDIAVANLKSAVVKRTQVTTSPRSPTFQGGIPVNQSHKMEFIPVLGDATRYITKGVDMPSIVSSGESERNSIHVPIFTDVSEPHTQVHIRRVVPNSLKANSSTQSLEPDAFDNNGNVVLNVDISSPN